MTRKERKGKGITQTHTNGKHTERKGNPPTPDSGLYVSFPRPQAPREKMEDGDRGPATATQIRDKNKPSVLSVTVTKRRSGQSIGAAGGGRRGNLESPSHA